MEIRNKAPRPEEVIVYTFEFALWNKALQIDIYPEQGDTEEYDQETGEFAFKFPRLDRIQVVERTSRLTYIREVQKRLFVDSREIQKQAADEIRKNLSKKLSAAEKFSTGNKGRRREPPTTTIETV